MRKLILLFIVLLLIMAVAASTFAGSRSGSRSGSRGRRNWDNARCFVMRNTHRNHALGGKSGRAWKGLENAAEHSRVIIEIVPDDPNTDGKGGPEEVQGDDDDGGDKEPDVIL